MKNRLALALATSALLLGGALSAAQDAAAPQKAAAAPAGEAAVIAAQLPSYPLSTCPISDEELDEGAVNVVAEGRLVRVCCKRCAAKVKESPAEAIAAVDAGVIADQGPRYPIGTCPVSGEELGEGAVDVVVGTKLVRTCCKRCAAKVKSDSTEAMAAVDAGWIEAGKKGYAVEVCPVSGEKLGSMGEPVDVLYGTRLVRLCCKGCVKKVRTDGAAVVAKLDELAAK